MSSQTSRAIVLHLTKYGDSGLIVHCLDYEAGRTAFFLRGVGKGKNSAALSALHTLSVVEVVSSPHPRGTLPLLKEYSPIFDLRRMRTDPSKGAMALFIGEVLFRTIRENDGDTALFSYLCDMIVRLDAAEGNYANFHLWFLTGFCRLYGFAPRNNRSELNRWFNVPSASFADSNVTGECFSEEDSLLLSLLLDSSCPEAMKIPLTGVRRTAFAKNMINYLSYHLGTSINIRSLAVLHEIFS